MSRRILLAALLLPSAAAAWAQRVCATVGAMYRRLATDGAWLAPDSVVALRAGEGAILAP